MWQLQHTTHHLKPTPNIIAVNVAWTWFTSATVPQVKAVNVHPDTVGFFPFFETHLHFLSSGSIPSFPKSRRQRKACNEREMGSSWSFSLFPASSSLQTRRGGFWSNTPDRHRQQVLKAFLAVTFCLAVQEPAALNLSSCRPCRKLL